ncbi:MAG: M15 family metallopeptidase [Oscillospiraceae bacterium]|nr:M15 family metallopeptidase [Oscillospiraceae bacterium]
MKLFPMICVYTIGREPVRKEALRMEHAAATPETEKEKRRKLILLIAMLLSLAVLIISIVFLARIKGWAGGSESTSLLSIVDSETPAPEDRQQTLSFIDDEHMIDERCAADLERLLRDCRGAGFEPVITAAYRSASEQRELFNILADSYMEEGADAESAKRLAQKKIPLPGHSEHQLGLAVDLADGREDDQAQRELQEWLAENAWEYGFILRYPEGRERITGHGFEPEHYRFVGAAAAKQIHELDLTLEEYVSMFYSR